MKTIATVCALTLAALCGTASAQSVQARTDCFRLGSFVNIALSQVKTRDTPLSATFVYRKFAVTPPLADKLSRAEDMLHAEQKLPDAVATELQSEWQSECEKAGLREAMVAQNTATLIN